MQKLDVRSKIFSKNEYLYSNILTMWLINTDNKFNALVAEQCISLYAIVTDHGLILTRTVAKKLKAKQQW